jgi:type I restriction enzyme, S subunit
VINTQVWQIARLGQFINLINGFAFASEKFTDGEGIPLIRIRDLENQETTVQYSGSFSDQYLIQNNDLLVGMDGDFITVEWKGGIALLNQRVCKIVSKDETKLNQSFIYYRIIDEISHIHQTTSATTVKHLSSKDILNIQIELPSIDEQAQIAAVLSTIDLTIAQTEAIITKQQRIKTGLMQDLLTKGIDENGNIRSEETHEFKDSPLGRIPVKWEARQIKSILSASPKNGYSPQESDSWQGAYMLGLGCLTANGFRPIQLKNAPSNDIYITNALLEDGDFLISRANTRDLVGLVGIYRDIGEPCIYPDLMVRLRFDDTTSIQYMHQVFLDTIVRRQIKNAATGTSSSMVKINAEIIKNCYFLCPELDEQNQIIYFLEKHHQVLTTYVKNLQKLKFQKTGLMQDLLTGKVRITELLKDIAL